MPIRPTSERVANTIHRLETDTDVWLATASPTGVPHLVPLSLGWDGTRLLLFTYTDSPTSSNIRSKEIARAALDGTVDVVIMDGKASIEPLVGVSPGVVDGFAERTGWDPRTEGSEFSLITMMPERVYAWNSVQELKGRLIMKSGQWLT